MYKTNLYTILLSLLFHTSEWKSKSFVFFSLQEIRIQHKMIACDTRKMKLSEHVRNRKIRYIQNLYHTCFKKHKFVSFSLKLFGHSCFFYFFSFIFFFCKTLSLRDIKEKKDECINIEILFYFYK